MTDLKYKLVLFVASLKEMQREGRLKEEDMWQILDMVDEFAISDTSLSQY